MITHIARVWINRVRLPICRIDSALLERSVVRQLQYYLDAASTLNALIGKKYTGTCHYFASRFVRRQINIGVPVRLLVREADDLLWLTSLYHDEKTMANVRVSYQPLGPR